MKTINSYEFPVLDPEDVPPEPDKLFVEDQLAAAIRNITGVDNVVVTGRFSRTVVRVDRDRSGEPIEIKVSWDVFADENRFNPGVGGWVVVCSSLINMGLVN